MAYSKVSLLFEYSTEPTGGGKQRSGGWSESFYNDVGAGSAELIRRIRLLAAARALAMPRITTIIGARMSDIGTNRSSQLLLLANPGAIADTTDIPQMALTWRQRVVNSQNVRPMTIRGIPDSWVTGGSLTWNADLGRFLNAWMATLFNGVWLSRGRNLNATQIPVDSITTGGLVTTNIDHGLSRGNELQVLRSIVDATGRARGGFAQISTTPPTPSSLQLDQWTWGASHGGTVRLASNVYNSFPNEVPAWGGLNVSTRKVGRSFFPYRGRASNR